MIVRKFMQWAQTASATARADGASALARAYLYADLDAGQKAEAEQALTSLLDDASPLVRRALAESFASATDAPHHIVLALADDQSDVSTIVLARSPLLTDSELIDCAAIGDTFAQSAIALRARLSAPVAAALAEVGSREALISLAVNSGAELPVFSMHRMIERCGDDGELREALLSRPHLPAALRSDLVVATSKALLAFVTHCNWITTERAERAAREAREKANVIIAIASEAEDNGPLKLVSHLRESGQLTAGLVLRALLSGNISLFEAALCELSGLPLARVKGLAGEWTSAGFAALYRKAGLPERLLPAFRAVLDALRTCGHDDPQSARLSLQMVERVLTACESAPGIFEDRLFSVLRRFEAEAAREEARLDLYESARDQAEVAGLICVDVQATQHGPQFVTPMAALFDGESKDTFADLENTQPVLVLTDADEAMESAAPPVELMIEAIVQAFEPASLLDEAKAEVVDLEPHPIKGEDSIEKTILMQETYVAAEPEPVPVVATDEQHSCESEVVVSSFEATPSFEDVPAVVDAAPPVAAPALILMEENCDCAIESIPQPVEVQMAEQFAAEQPVAEAALNQSEVTKPKTYLRYTIDLDAFEAQLMAA